MVNPKHSLRAVIFKVKTEYDNDNSKLEIAVSKFHFSQENQSRIEVGHQGYDVANMYFDKDTANAYGIPWDGTKKNADEISEYLKGHEFDFTRGIKPELKENICKIIELTNEYKHTQSEE